MNPLTQKPNRLVLALMTLMVMLLVVTAFFAVRTQGFGYFVTPTPTLTPTSTISLYGVDPLVTQTVTPFQPLPTDTSTPTMTPTATPTETPTATATSTPLPTNTPRPTATPIPIPTNVPEDGLPSSYYISGVVGHNQAHSLSCESRAAADWAAFYSVSISENSFQSALPVSDDPDKGFVGNVNGAEGQIPPNDYGVHAGPVASLLQQYGVSATAHKGYSLSDLRHQIASGNPVIVWVVGNVWTGSPVSYTASDGNTTTVAYNEHVVIVFGYDETGFDFVDGAYTYWRSNAVFKSSFAALGNMAITH
jgi:uncharacterized protein YvpB